MSVAFILVCFHGKEWGTILEKPYIELWLDLKWPVVPSAGDEVVIGKTVSEQAWGHYRVEEVSHSFDDDPAITVRLRPNLEKIGFWSRGLEQA